MPPRIDLHGSTGRNRSKHIVAEKRLEKGYSTPSVAGRFAKYIGAKRLALNHSDAR